MLTSQNTRCAITLFPTPLFNTPEFAFHFEKKDGSSLPLDKEGLLRTVETILFPNSPVTLLEPMPQPHIWSVQTEEYPYEGSFFTDIRFLLKVSRQPPPRQKILPSIAEIKIKMKQFEKTPYIWGGNWPTGVDLITKFYPGNPHHLKWNDSVQDIWQLRGVDCSGLLYFITNGWTPRNTSSLVSFGSSVNIARKSPLTILKQLQDLDLIVWKGHVIYIFDQNTTIESRAGKGVVLCDALERLTEIMKEREPANEWSDPSQFVIRRWYSAST